MLNKLFLLTDEQIKDIFENCRNLGICGAVFAALDWEWAQIISIDSAMSLFNTFILSILLLVGLYLFFLAQVQAFRKLKAFGFIGMKLRISSLLYTLATTFLMGSIFLH